MQMSDQTWAMIIGFGVVVGLRILDWLMPKGWISIWAAKHGVKPKDPDEDE